MSQDTTSTDISLKVRPLFRVVRKEEEHLYFGVKLNDGRWTKEEHKEFIDALLELGIRNWKKVMTNKYN
jgi:hypothetical protein